jgi:hypothetical protein
LTDAPEENPVAASAAEVSFADIDMDDQMIEERPAAQNDDDAPAPFVLRPDIDAEAEDNDMTGSNTSISASDADAVRDEDEDVTLISVASPFFAQTTPTTEDSLLDLDDGAPPQSMTEADDFILDLADDAPPSSSASNAVSSAVSSTAAWTDEHGARSSGASATVVAETDARDEAEPQMISAGAMSEVDAQGAFAEAAHGDSEDDTMDDMPTMIAVAAAPATDDEETGGIAPESVDRDDAAGAYGLSHVLEKSGTITNASVPGLSEQASESCADATGIVGRETSGMVYQEPDTDAVAPSQTMSGTQGTGAAAAGGGQITLEQLSPEVIDAIVRRAVEHLSERVVRDIAWEVVPDLAELLIKKRLEEQR